MIVNDFKEDAPITHGAGIKSYWHNMFKWGGFATKQEFLHGFLFNLYVGLTVGIVFIVGVFSTALAVAISTNHPKNSGSFDILNSTNLNVGGITLGVVSFILLLFLLGVVFWIANTSLQIRRLRSAGIDIGWIVASILAPLFCACIPFFGWMFSFAIIICVYIICFSRPSIANRGYVYSFMDVLTNSYAAPKAKHQSQPATSTAPSSQNGTPQTKKNADQNVGQNVEQSNAPDGTTSNDSSQTNW